MNNLRSALIAVDLFYEGHEIVDRRYDNLLTVCFQDTRDVPLGLVAGDTFDVTWDLFIQAPIYSVQYYEERPTAIVRVVIVFTVFAAYLRLCEVMDRNHYSAEYLTSDEEEFWKWEFTEGPDRGIGSGDNPDGKHL